MWLSGSITPPSGVATYFDQSFANLNALRIAVEREGNTSAPFGDNSEYSVPFNPELVLSALICIFVGGFLAYNASSGSAGGLPFQGAMANRQLAGETVVAPGYFSQCMVGFLSLMLGMVSP